MIFSIPKYYPLVGLIGGPLFSFCFTEYVKNLQFGSWDFVGIAKAR